MAPKVEARDFIALLPDPAVILSLEGEVLSANPKFCRKLGVHPGDLEGRSFLSLCANGESVSQFLANASGVGDPMLGAVVLKGSAGDRRFRCYGARLGGLGGRLVFLRFQEGEVASGHFRILNEQIGALQREVAQRRRIEQTLRELAAIVESSGDAILSKNLDGIITSWNAAAERMFGYTAAEVIGRPSSILVLPENVAAEAAVLDRVRWGERLEHYETVRIRKDGTALEVSLTVSPIKDETGQIVGTSKIVRNITKQKQMARALAEARSRLRSYADELEQRVEERTALLQESVRSLDGFCYTMAHDLRAPLRAMMGFSLELLEQYGPVLGEEGCDFARRIKEAAFRMDRLLTDLLEYGRLNTIQIPLTTLQLDPIVADVLKETEAQIRRIGADVKVKAPLAPVLGNAVVLRQIISNLLSNALKFVPAETAPLVEVWTENGGQTTRLFVRDNGIGIRDKHRDRLFQPFVRLVRQDEYPGTGIGLAIVRKAAERMGGRVGCDSNAGPGSLFWVEVPSPGNAGKDSCAEPSETSGPMHCEI